MTFRELTGSDNHRCWRLSMSLGVGAAPLRGGSGTEPPHRVKDRSGEHKRDSRGRTSLPSRSNVQIADGWDKIHPAQFHSPSSLAAHANVLAGHATLVGVFCEL